MWERYTCVVKISALAVTESAKSQVVQRVLLTLISDWYMSLANTNCYGCHIRAPNQRVSVGRTSTQEVSMLMMDDCQPPIESSH